MAYNILIVDDSKTMRSVLVKTLSMTDLKLGEVYVAENGRDALDKLRDHWVDLVMTDLNMPEMTGLELIDRMAADGMLKSTPVIVISTDGSAERVQDLIQKGVRVFIRKPFTPEAITEAITKVLGVTNEGPTG
jgi:two-component system chemotaxis response regulator CheY